MSADTTFAVAKCGGKFYAAIVQAAENLLDPSRSVRWETAQHYFLTKRHFGPWPFDTLSNALGHRECLTGEEGVYIEHSDPVLVEILLANKDVRELRV